MLRHPSFEGLRIDKDPREVHREVEQSTPRVSQGESQRIDARGLGKPTVDGIAVSHPDRVMDTETGLTKLDLVRYASAVAETMFPYVAKRPLMLLRCPGGTETSVFRRI